MVQLWLKTITNQELDAYIEFYRKRAVIFALLGKKGDADHYDCRCQIALFTCEKNQRAQATLKEQTHDH